MNSLRFLNTQQLCERWKLDSNQLKSLIIKHDIPLYIFDNKLPIDAPEFYLLKEGLDHVPNLTTARMVTDFGPFDIFYFSIPDIEAIEKDHLELNSRNSLSAKDARELGRLRIEQKKTEDILRASVFAGLFAANASRPIIKPELWGELENHGLGKIPERAFRVIWETIPQKYRHTGGRPKTMTS